MGRLQLPPPLLPSSEQLWYPCWLWSERMLGSRSGCCFLNYNQQGPDQDPGHRPPRTLDDSLPATIRPDSMSNKQVPDPFAVGCDDGQRDVTPLRSVNLT